MKRTRLAVFAMLSLTTALASCTPATSSLSATGSQSSSSESFESLAAKVTSIEKTSENTFKDTYTVSFDDGTSSTFDIENQKANFSKEMNINTGLDRDPDGGADAYENAGDHEDDYFYSMDFYNAKNTATFAILPNYQTYQQTDEYTCGAAASLMALNYYGELGNYNESSLWDLAQGTHDGLSLAQVIAIFQGVGGFDLDSTYDHMDAEGNLDEDYFTPENMSAVIQGNIAKGIPTLVDWRDWGGHWETIIGYDNMGTDTIGDDVIVVSDSYDTSDHCQDGYGVYGYERFFYNWYPAESLATNENAYLYVAPLPAGTSSFAREYHSTVAQDLVNGGQISSVAKLSDTASGDLYEIAFADGSAKQIGIDNNHANFSDEMNFNTPTVDLDPEAGADAYGKAGDFADQYFYNLDIYNMQDTDTRHILTNFKTYQQTNEGSCGPVSLLMALNYLDSGNTLTEKDIWDARPTADNHGTSLIQLLAVVDQIGGYDVTSTYDYMDTDGSLDEDFFWSDEGMHMIENYIAQGIPVLIGWNDWGGHWETVIGYDNMGTDSIGDDVMIVADPYDTSDHCQDGYGVYGCERFFYNWTMDGFYAGSAAAVENDFLFAAIKKA